MNRLGAKLENPSVVFCFVGQMVAGNQTIKGYCFTWTWPGALDED